MSSKIIREKPKMPVMSWAEGPVKDILLGWNLE